MSAAAAGQEPIAWMVEILWNGEPSSERAHLYRRGPEADRIIEQYRTWDGDLTARITPLVAADPQRDHDLTSLVAELAALPTLGEWQAAPGGDINSRLDALILRARTLMGK
jgi:hypothetical protein